MERRKRRWLVAGALLLALSVVGACLAYPRWRVEVMMRNEFWAVHYLRVLCAAQRDYHANDLDKNGIHDFWTADVSEFSRLGLLPREVGLADARPHTPLAAMPVPYKGYYFEALETDDSASPPESYRQDTDQKSGKVHHLRKFAFVAYPARPGVTGRYVFILNDTNNVFFIHDATRKPSGWPTDHELRMEWPHYCD